MTQPGFPNSPSAGSSSGAAFTVSAKTASYSVTDEDLAGNQYHTVSNASNVNVTVPSGLTGTNPLTVEQIGAGTVTFVAGGGVTINSADSNLLIGAQYGAVTLVPKGSDVYSLIGSLTSA